MKKSLLLFLLLLPLLAAPVFAQESRQDISVSGTAIIPPFASGERRPASRHRRIRRQPSSAIAICSPRTAVWSSTTSTTRTSSTSSTRGSSYNIHDRFQEISGAYVYSFNFRNWNPFIEGGAAGFLFSPIDDAKTNTFSISRSTNVGGMYGAGIAYEISPSFDIRAEYRGLVMKTPTFNYPATISAPTSTTTSTTRSSASLTTSKSRRLTQKWAGHIAQPIFNHPAVLLLSQESVSHPHAEPVRRQAAVVLHHCARRGIVGRRPGKRWPDLPLIIPAENQPMRQRIVQRSTWGVREVAALQAARRRVVDRCDPSAAHLHLEPARRGA